MGIIKDAVDPGTGSMVKLGTATVAGAAATTLTLGSLDLSAYTAFRVIGKLENATGSTAQIRLFYNADTTATNYYQQRLTASSTTVSGASSNNAELQAFSANAFWNFTIDIESGVDGKPTADFSAVQQTGTGIIMRKSMHFWTTAANVTTITFSSDIASALDIGSTFTVYGIT